MAKEVLTDFYEYLFQYLPSNFLYLLPDFGYKHSINFAAAAGFLGQLCALQIYVVPNKT